MKYIYAAIIALCSTTGYSYETLTPVYVQTQPVLVQPQPVQVMVYYAPAFTVTVPVPVQVVPVYTVNPTVYWGYPYQPAGSNYWHHRCRLFNFNY
jgi:hypothetical protein